MHFGERISTPQRLSQRGALTGGDSQRLVHQTDEISEPPPSKGHVGSSQPVGAARGRSTSHCKGHLVSTKPLACTPFRSDKHSDNFRYAVKSQWDASRSQDALEAEAAKTQALAQMEPMVMILTDSLGFDRQTQTPVGSIFRTTTTVLFHAGRRNAQMSEVSLSDSRCAESYIMVVSE